MQKIVLGKNGLISHGSSMADVEATGTTMTTPTTDTMPPGSESLGDVSPTASRGATDLVPHGGAQGAAQSRLLRDTG